MGYPVPETVPEACANRGTCLYPDVLAERLNHAERLSSEHIAEAARYRMLWTVAAAYIRRQVDAGKAPKANGADEERMLRYAAEWAGVGGNGSDGWLTNQGWVTPPLFNDD